MDNTTIKEEPCSCYYASYEKCKDIQQRKRVLNLLQTRYIENKTTLQLVSI